MSFIHHYWVKEIDCKKVNIPCDRQAMYLPTVVLVHLPYHGVSAYLGRLGLAPT
jgi:hypothetical protein